MKISSRFRRSDADAVVVNTRSTQKLALTSLPLPDMTMFMRYLGSELVFSLLHARRPRLTQAITLANRWQLLSQVNAHPQLFADGVQRAIQKDMPEWINSVVIETERRLGLQNGWNAPRDQWTLIGMQAWLDPSYRYRIMRRIEVDMRCRLWYGVEEAPAVQLTPTLYWMLIALVPPQTRFLLQAVRRVFPNAQRSPFENLQEIAHSIAQTSSEPITIWDQWLLLHVSALWKPKRERPNDLLWSRINMLPLWQIVNPPHTMPSDLTIPTWFGSWLQAGNYLLYSPQGAQDDDES